MRTLNVEEIAKLDKGEVIPSVYGTVENVYQRREGSSEKGDWSVQDVVLQIEGEPIKIKFWNHDDLSSIRGKEITVRAFEGKNGLTSLFAEDDTYKGKTTRVIRATSACKIVVGLNGEDGRPTTLGRISDEDQIPMSHDEKGQALPGMDEVRAHIQQAVNLYNLVVDFVDDQVKPHINDCSAELYQAAIGSLFIEGSRSGLIGKMPVKAIKPPAKPF